MQSWSRWAMALHDCTAAPSRRPHVDVHPTLYIDTLRRDVTRCINLRSRLTRLREWIRWTLEHTRPTQCLPETSRRRVDCPAHFECRKFLSRTFDLLSGNHPVARTTESESVPKVIINYIIIFFLNCSQQFGNSKCCFRMLFDKIASVLFYLKNVLIF